MKNSLRVFVLLTLSCAVLTVFASADMGPKPQLTVRVEHAPEELYYLDLLAEGEYEDYTYGDGNSPYSGLDWSYSDEEAAALNEDLLDALRAHRPRYALCGHIPTGDHNPIVLNHDDGSKTIVRNVSRLDEEYEIRFEPYVFEL